jgi:hypothetical protein
MLLASLNSEPVPAKSAEVSQYGTNTRKIVTISAKGKEKTRCDGFKRKQFGNSEIAGKSTRGSSEMTTLPTKREKVERMIDAYAFNNS